VRSHQKFVVFRSLSAHRYEKYVILFLSNSNNFRAGFSFSTQSLPSPFSYSCLRWKQLTEVFRLSSRTITAHHRTSFPTSDTSTWLQLTLASHNGLQLTLRPIQHNPLSTKATATKRKPILSHNLSHPHRLTTRSQVATLTTELAHSQHSAVDRKTLADGSERLSVHSFSHGHCISWTLHQVL
jgi:hypothetical protein